MLHHSKISIVTLKDVPLIYDLKCLKCQKNLSITLPKPSFRPRPEHTECSGPHVLLTVQTEPRPHALVKANDASCPQTWGMRDMSARCLPLSMFTLWKLKTAGLSGHNMKCLEMFLCPPPPPQ